MNVSKSTSTPTVDSTKSEPEPESEPTAFPTSISEITFSNSDVTINPSIYKTLSTLRKSTLSIPNRLRSISLDASFIESSFTRPKSKYFGFPLVANERCGSWYIAPHLKRGSAYFKSTDGHHGQWAFSLRRLNLKLLEILGDHGGAVLVDSTRRGKRLPDALRRTVPIWVAVWNRVLFGGGVKSSAHGTVCDACLEKSFILQSCGLDESEVTQINARLDGWVASLRGLGLDLESIKSTTRCPIRCVWVVPGENESLPDGWDSGACPHALLDGATERVWNTLVLCSASKPVVGAEMSEDGYIQGAGDDSEGWSCGLTSGLFWDNQTALISAAEEELPDLIQDLIRNANGSARHVEAHRIAPTENIYIAAGNLPDLDELGRQYDLVLSCNQHHTHVDDKRFVGLSCRSGKLGSKDLREKLGVVKDAAERTLNENRNARILVLCENGRDHSVGVAVTLLCSFHDETGLVELDCAQKPATKQLIKQRLAWITSSKPEANPSRSTLQAVNSFLIDRPS